MEIDRWRVYLFVCESLCGLGALLSALAGKWDVAACGWSLACYCAINRFDKPTDKGK